MIMLTSQLTHLNAIVQQESQSPLIRSSVSVCNQAEQIAILLLQVTLAEKDQSDLEAEDADLAGPL